MRSATVFIFALTVEYSLLSAAAMAFLSPISSSSLNPDAIMLFILLLIKAATLSISCWFVFIITSISSALQDIFRLPISIFINALEN